MIQLHEAISCCQIQQLDMRIHLSALVRCESSNFEFLFMEMAVTSSFPSVVDSRYLHSNDINRCRTHCFIIEPLEPTVQRFMLLFDGRTVDILCSDEILVPGSLLCSISNGNEVDSSILISNPDSIGIASPLLRFCIPTDLAVFNTLLHFNLSSRMS